MGKAIATQHPAVVLRSHYRQVRTPLAVAMIALVGVTAAVVILAADSDRDTGAGSATQVSAPDQGGGARYDGGPEEATGGVVPAQPPNTRYDGGPEEGTRGAPSYRAPANTAPATRYDGGPDEGSGGPRR